MKIARKNLTPNQFRRSNTLMGASLTLIELVFIFLSIRQTPIVSIPKIVFVVVFVLAILISAVYVQKNVESRSAMLFMALMFTATYGFLLFTHEVDCAMLVFPVLMTMTVYLSEVLIMCGAAMTSLLCVIKFVQMQMMGTSPGSDEFLIADVIVLGIVICVYGGCRAVHKLIDYSEEDSAVIEKKAIQQAKVAQEVSDIVERLDRDFHKVVTELNSLTEAANDANDAMDEISSGSDTTANAAVKQAEKTSEIQDRLEHTGQVTEEANETTTKLLSAIENGKRCSDELEKQSVLVDQSTAQISETVSHLVENVSKVTNITESILAISSQTNLLALNASIEAARAGEAGKGFAVVADEIRQLADETRTSTEMITAIITELTKVTEETQKELAASVESIQVQREKVKEVNASFNTVEEGMSVLSDNVNQMNEEFSAVLSANQGIVEGISTLSGISEEISASTTTSKDDIDKLVNTMSEFSEIVDGTFEVLQHLKETATVD